MSASVHTPESIGGPGSSPIHIKERIAGPIRFPPRQFQALFDSLFKVLFIFPRGTCSLSDSRYLALDGILLGLGLHSQTTRLDDGSSWCDGSEHDGALTSRRPFPGDLNRSVGEDASTDYNSNDVAVRFSSLGSSGSLAVTKGIYQPCTRRGRPISITTCEKWIAVHHVALSERALSQKSRAQLAFKNFDGSRDYAIHTKYRISLRSSSMRERDIRYSLARVARILFLNNKDPMGAASQMLRCQWFTGRFASINNDPSAGSPTETLLRLLLPLNDKVRWTSRDVVGGEPPRRRDPNTSLRDHSIGRSDGRCVQRAGT
ncbi:hypothetical protein Syun_031895 [Stephania yunnanensis]|uniref:Uncharacterized protein n=1 Tax=Stephania yunnanensis TaxID=152371 RepID=A0AAP0DTU6_9MAGN